MIARDMSERLRATRPASAEWYARAQQVVAGGVGHDLRWATPAPTCISHGQGAYKWDVDGHRYIDYGLGNAALLLGHAHPAIVAAVRDAVGRGTHFGNDHPAQIQWARRCAGWSRAPSACASSTRGARRTCWPRGWRGRSPGAASCCASRGTSTAGTTTSPPASPSPSTCRRPAASRRGRSWARVAIPANDLARLDALLHADRDIAAVILEPSGASWGTVPLADGFLAGVREVTQRHGVLLIFDEVITGFRWAPGGAQERFGVVPDLSTHAKVIAGGMPGAAVCGRVDVMDQMTIRGDARRDRHERVMHLGTFNANPVSAGAALACLEIVATGEPAAARRRYRRAAPRGAGRGAGQARGGRLRVRRRLDLPRLPGGGARERPPARGAADAGRRDAQVHPGPGGERDPERAPGARRGADELHRRRHERGALGGGCGGDRGGLRRPGRRAGRPRPGTV